MKSYSRILWVLLVLAISVFAAVADDEGHHHEDLTQGQLGTVHFPVSCDAKVQQSFERGVALLHSFWYSQVEKQFTVIAKDDPTCAMAHWGIAMGMWHQLWDTPDAKMIAKGRAEVKKAEALHPKTQRERDYIAAIGAFYSDSQKCDHHARAVAYSDAMEAIYKKYPEDREAAAFYALSLLASEPEADTTFANRKKAASVLEVLFKEEPNHPGVAHYLIHTYDKPQLAALGLPAARRYAEIAPASPHALHMPSHIYARLGLWQDDIRSNLASKAAAEVKTGPRVGAENRLHAMEFLEYAYLQIGHENEARAIVVEAPSVKATDVDPQIDGSYYPQIQARYPALLAIETHDWATAARLQAPKGGLWYVQSLTLLAHAMAAAHTHDVAAAKEAAAAMNALVPKGVPELQPGGANAG